MPTSATGEAGPARPCGFTLLELMVVILLIGLAASAVMLSLPGGPDAAREAERLAARLAAARNLAIAANQPTALVLSPGGYRFEQRGPQGWGPAEAGRRAGALGDHRLPDGLRLQAAIAGAGPRLVFEPTGLATPATLALGGQKITVSAAGEIRVQ